MPEKAPVLGQLPLTPQVEHASRLRRLPRFVLIAFTGWKSSLDLTQSPKKAELGCELDVFRQLTRPVLLRGLDPPAFRRPFAALEPALTLYAR